MRAVYDTKIPMWNLFSRIFAQKEETSEANRVALCTDL
jgi:hypothetical protein